MRHIAHRHLKLLNETIAAIAAASDFESSLRALLRRFGRHLDCEYGEAWSPTDTREDLQLELKTTWHRYEDTPDDETPHSLESFIQPSWEEVFKPGEGFPGRIWTAVESSWVGDITEPHWYHRAARAAEADFRSALDVPVARDGEPVAVVIWYTRQHVQQDPVTVRPCEALSAHLGAVLRRREVEEALRDEHERFQAVVSNIHEVLWMSTRGKGEMVYVNPAYERICGRPAGELYDNPMSWLEAIHPDDRSRVRDAADRQTQGAYDERYRILRPRGEIRWIHDRAYPIRRDGEVLRIVGVAQDVTDQKRIEDRLRESEHKFADAFRMNPLAMAIVTIDERRFVDVNEGFCELTGLARGEVLARSGRDFDLWASETDREQASRELEATGSLRKFEATLHRKDGEIRNVSISGQPIDVAGTRCLLTATKDITDEKRYREELEHQNFHDALTGFANHSLYRDRLEHALELARCGGSETAVVLDVERFKVVNGTLGHSEGDHLLQVIAERLTRQLDERVTVARFGSDEFVLLFEQIDDIETIEARCRRLLADITEPCLLGDTVVHLSPPTAANGCCWRPC